MPQAATPPVIPAHGRALGLIGVSLTRTRMPKGTEAALAVARDQLEEVLVSTGFLQDAPFSWVTIALRFGLIDASRPNINPISKRHGDLPLSIEIDVRPLHGASTSSCQASYIRAAATALAFAGKKYGRPAASLRALSTLADQTVRREGSIGDA